MYLNDEMLEELKCNINKRDHILNDARLLPCNHSCCKACILALKGKKFICQHPGCNEQHKIRDVDKLTPNATIQSCVKIFENELKEIFRTRIAELNEKVENITLMIAMENSISDIEMDIDVRIESLKQDIENLQETLRYQTLTEKTKALTPSYINQQNEGRELIEFTKNNMDKMNLYSLHESFFRLKRINKSLKDENRNILYLISTNVIDAGKVGVIDKTEEITTKIEEKQEKIIKCNFEKLFRHEVIYNDVHGKCFARLAHFHSKGIIIASDTASRNLTFFNDDSMSKIRTFESDKLECPLSICINSYNEVFIGDTKASKIVVFDRNFKFLRDYEKSQQLPIDKLFNMTVDEQDNHLYVCEKNQNIILELDCDDCSVPIRTIPLELPTYIKVSDEKIFVCSGSINERKGFLNEDQKSVKCESAVHILDKKSLSHLKKVKFNNWVNLRGLHIDSSFNIFTTANEGSPFKDISVHFNPHVTFFKFNSEGTLISKQTLDNEIVRDILFLEKEIIIARGKNNEIYRIKAKISKV